MTEFIVFLSEVVDEIRHGQHPSVLIASYSAHRSQLFLEYFIELIHLFRSNVLQVRHSHNDFRTNRVGKLLEYGYLLAQLQMCDD